MGKLLSRVYLDVVLRLRNEEKGQTLVEYALIGVLIAVAVSALLTGLGTKIGSELTKITDTLT